MGEASTSQNDLVDTEISNLVKNTLLEEFINTVQKIKYQKWYALFTRIINNE